MTWSSFPLAAAGLVLLALALYRHQRSAGPVRALWLLLVLVPALLLGLHGWPGFSRIDLWQGQLSPCAVPGRWGLGLDKGLAGLILLIGLRHPRPAAPAVDRAVLVLRLATGVGLILALGVLTGFVKWQPAPPPWWAGWLLSHLVLTVVAEEALFRGLLQAELERVWHVQTWGRPAALLATAVVFAVAHVAGGPLYMLLALLAGLLYGHLWQAGRSLLWPIAAHMLLNGLHFMLLTWPAANGLACPG